VKRELRPSLEPESEDRARLDAEQLAVWGSEELKAKLATMLRR